MKKSSDFKVVCNFWSHAWSRSGNRKYKPEDIDEKLCSHIVYNSAKLDPTTLTIEVKDPAVDIDEGFYRRATDFKKKGVPVLISIGRHCDNIDRR